MEETIEMKIAKMAALNWGQAEPKNLEEALGITGDSEVSAVEGVIQVLGLSAQEFEQLIGTKDENGNIQRNGEIYIKDSLSEDIATKISKRMNGESKEKLVLKILSVVHDNWVVKNSNNFMKPDRNKERQFVPLQMLNWGEVESDLIFLKTILNSAGVTIDEDKLKEEFEIQQQEYMIDNGILSHADLVSFLGKGADFYPTLKGIETAHGGKIEELLANTEIAKQMAIQIESKVEIKSREELAKDLIKSNNELLDKVSWLKTTSNENPTIFRNYNNPISKREELLSKLIGKPYPAYFLGAKSLNNDKYESEIRTPKELECDAAFLYEGKISQRKADAKGLDTSLDETKILKFGKNKYGYEMEETISVTPRELLEAGLDASQMELTTGKNIVSPKDIAEAEMNKETALTTTEVGRIKSFINKILQIFKGKGEK